MCVLGLGFRLRPATPGWGVGVFVCLCVRSACTAPLVGRVCGVGVCAWARILPPPRHSWLGCWGSVCACVRALLVPRPSWLQCGGVLVCVRAPLVPRHSWLGCAVWACVLELGFRLCPATPRWGVRCGCVCLGSGFSCAPPLLARVLVCLCVPVCALRLYPATPGWGVRCGSVCFGSESRLRPASCGWGVGVCVCLCACPACNQPLLAAVVVCGLGVTWHLFWCPGLLRVVLAARVYGTRWPFLLGPCPCALVVAGGVPLWRAWWPRVVRRASSGPVTLGALVSFPDAVVPFPNRAPGFTGSLPGAHGGRPRTGLIVPAAGPRRGRDAGLAPRRTRSGPRDRVVPGGSLRRRSSAACPVDGCVCGPGHCRVRFPVPSVFRQGTRSVHQGCFVWTSSPPPACRRTPRPGPVRVCVCSSVLAGSGGPASRARFGAPHLFPWPLCLFALLGPLRAGVVPFVALWLPPPSPAVFFFLLFHFPCAPLVSFFLWSLAPGALCLGAFFFFPSPPPGLCLFFFVVRPLCLWLSLVSGPGCPGPWRCVLFVLLASRSSALRALSPLCWFPPGRWLRPGGCCPPSLFFCLAVFLAAAL